MTITNVSLCDPLTLKLLDRIKFRDYLKMEATRSSET